MLDVQLCCFGVVMTGEFFVTLSRVGVVRSNLKVAGFEMLCRFAVVPRGIFVVFGCFAMMVRCLL